MTNAIGELENQLRAQGTPERAAGSKAYLKSSLEHFGVTNPQARRIIRQWVRDNKIASHDDVVQIAQRLWPSQIFDLRNAAVEVLTYRKSTLTVADLGMLADMIRTANTWAFVDPLSSVAGTIVMIDPADSTLSSTLDAWATDENFWLRRAAMLSQMGEARRVDGDASRFFRYADSMLEEKEFFIRKAIGWVLREMSKKRPVLVFEWIRPRASQASGVTIREAVKYLTEDQRAAVLASR